MTKSLSLVLFLTLVGCSAPTINPIASAKYSAIVRLTDAGRFYCTAFVISDRYAVTAAHCVQSEFMGMFVSQAPTVDVANSLGDYVVSAKVVGANSRIDYALLQGDFRNFNKVQMDYTERVYYAPRFAACGYPQNSKALRCSKLVNVGTKFFQMRGKGELVFGGHSGGPVFDLQTGKVVGVVSAVDDGGVLFAPIIELPSTFGLPRGI